MKVRKLSDAMKVFCTIHRAVQLMELTTALININCMDEGGGYLRETHNSRSACTFFINFTICQLVRVLLNSNTYNISISSTFDFCKTKGKIYIDIVPVRDLFYTVCFEIFCQYPRIEDFLGI